MADLIAIAETLEVQAAALRREAARLAAVDQAELALEPEPRPWQDWSGGEMPAEVQGKNVDVRLRDGHEMSGPAHALTWPYDQGRPENEGGRDIVAYRISADQPDG